MIKYIMKTLMKELKPKLEAEGFAVFYKETENNSAQLIIPVAKEDGSSLNIELNTISDPQEMYPQHHLLQIFMSIPIQVDDASFQEVSQVISQLNIELSLGSFNLHLSGIVFFKYTLLLKKSSVDTIIEPLMDAIDISNHVFQTYEPHITSFLAN